MQQGASVVPTSVVDQRDTRRSIASLEGKRRSGIPKVWCMQTANLCQSQPDLRVEPHLLGLSQTNAP